MKEKSLKQGVGKTQDGQTLRPKPKKSLIFRTGQKTISKKGERTHTQQDTGLPKFLTSTKEVRKKTTLIFAKNL